MDEALFCFGANERCECIIRLGSVVFFSELLSQRFCNFVRGML